MRALPGFARTPARPSAEPAPAAALSASADRSAPAGAGIALLPPLQRASPPPGIRRVDRRPQTRQRLGRLRQELSRICPAPACPQDAHGEILRALARAGLGDWTVPALDDAAVRRCAGGSVCVPLISHVIVFNPNGAFRIVDVFAGRHVYFEMASRDGTPFALPPDAVLPG